MRGLVHAAHRAEASKVFGLVPLVLLLLLRLLLRLLLNPQVFVHPGLRVVQGPLDPPAAQQEVPRLLLPRHPPLAPLGRRVDGNQAVVDAVHVVVGAAVEVGGQPIDPDARLVELEHVALPVHDLVVGVRQPLVLLLRGVPRRVRHRLVDVERPRVVVHPRLLEALGPVVLPGHAAPLPLHLVDAPLHRGVVRLPVHVARELPRAPVLVPQPLRVRLGVPRGVGHTAIDVNGPPVRRHPLVVQRLAVAAGAVPLVGPEPGVAASAGRREPVVLLVQVCLGPVFGKDRHRHV
mmetsp:Transcript_7880/g.19171  ORF Transcript_7880/g.19171 Transcript_7880/m.19171 type:complete len:291 (+) Transcript_7880:107-979(+)